MKRYLMLIIIVTMFIFPDKVYAAKQSDQGDEYLSRAENSAVMATPQSTSANAQIAIAYYLRDIRNILSEIKDKEKYEDQEIQSHSGS